MLLQQGAKYVSLFQWVKLAGNRRLSGPKVVHHHFISFQQLVDFRQHFKKSECNTHQATESKSWRYGLIWDWTPPFIIPQLLSRDQSTQHSIFWHEIHYLLEHEFISFRLCRRQLAYRPDPNLSPCRPRSQSCTESQNHAELQSHRLET